MPNNIADDYDQVPAKLRNPLEDEKLPHLAETPTKEPTGMDIPSIRTAAEPTGDHKPRELPKFWGEAW